MTARDLVDLLAARPALVAAALAAPPAAAFLAGLLHPRGRGGLAPWRHVYSLLVYLACVPGMLALVLTGYVLFFTRESLLDASLVVHALPVASMALTLLLVRRSADFADLPGFDRLSGLMAMLAATFVLVLALSRTRVWLVFGGSIATLALGSAFVFAVLRWGAHAAFRRRDEPPRERPELPRI